MSTGIEDRLAGVIIRGRILYIFMHTSKQTNALTRILLINNILVYMYIEYRHEYLLL